MLCCCKCQIIFLCIWSSQHVFDMLYNPVKVVLALLNVVAYVKSLSQFPYCGVKILKILHPNISICKFYANI
jgi:hypothetical protein